MKGVLVDQSFSLLSSVVRGTTMLFLVLVFGPIWSYY